MNVQTLVIKVHLGPKVVSCDIIDSVGTHVCNHYSSHTSSPDSVHLIDSAESVVILLCISG